MRRSTATIYIALTFATAATGLGVALTATAEPAATQQVKLASGTQQLKDSAITKQLPVDGVFTRRQRLKDSAITKQLPVDGVVTQPTPAPTPSPRPFLFKYTFNKHLKIGGGNFTVGGRVYLAVKFNTDRVAFSRNVTAQPHSITPGGAIYVETTIAAPCGPSSNGYAAAYDYTTKTWSPTLPVTICVAFDQGSAGVPASN